MGQWRTARFPLRGQGFAYKKSGEMRRGYILPEVL